MFTFRYFIKVFIITTISILMLLVGLMGLVVMQRQKIADRLLLALSEQVSIPLSHTSFDFSLAKSFPLASMVLNNAVVMYPNSDTDTLLCINELSVAFNLINTINRDYRIKAIKLNGGFVKLKSARLRQLSGQLGMGQGTAPRTPDSTKIQFDHIAISGLLLSHFDNSDRLSNKVLIDKTHVNLKLDNETVYFHLKGIAQIIVPQCSISDNPLNIEAAITKHGRQWNIGALNVAHRHIALRTSGRYIDQSLMLQFASNTFKAKRLAHMLGINGVEGGSCRANGRLSYLFDSGTFGPVSVRHSSRNLVVKVGDEKLHIDELDGHSTLSDNFKQHSSHIERIAMRLDGASAQGSMRLKGLKRMALLADMELNAPGIPMVELPGWALSAHGHAKALARLDLSAPDCPQLEVRAVGGQLQVDIPKNPLLPSLSHMRATATLGRHIQVEAQGVLQGSPVTATALMYNTQRIINTGQVSRIETSIACRTLNLGGLLDEIERIERSDDKKNNMQYVINYNVDTLLFMNKTIKHVTGRLYERHDTLYADRLRGEMYSGMLAGDVAMHNGRFNIDGRLQQMDVAVLFADNQNFNQQIVTSSNISGRLNARLRLHFASHEEPPGIDPNSLRLAADVELLQGKLSGMDKIKQLDKWLNLSAVKSIDFNTMHNTIVIDTGWVQIPSMSISSNVLNITLDGAHSFQGSFDYHVRLNLAQLLANRFMNKSGAADFDRQSDNGIHINLIISGDSSGYQIKRDRARAKQHLRAEVEKERAQLRNVVLEEFGRKRDTIAPARDTAKAAPKPTQNTGYRVVWDDDEEE